MKKTIKIIIVLVIIAAVIGLLFKFKGGKKKETYKTEPVRMARIVEQVEASGTINPTTETSVGTQVSGRVQEIFVDYNSIVKQGDLLAVIDPSTYESAVVQQEANLLKVESEYTNKMRNYERYRKLYKQELVAKSELDDAETAYLQAKAQVTQAKASLDKAKIDLGYTQITSPVNGIVISKEVELGQTVAASFNTPTLFSVAEDLTKMQIEVNISEADISKIKEGQDVDFNVDAYSDTTFKGKVVQVRNSPITTSNVVTYTVVVSVDNSDLKLKPGMTANASIITAVRDNALSVSNQSLRFVPPSDAKIKMTGNENRRNFKGQGVWKQDPQTGELERIEIQTGSTDGNKTEITSGNITEGTQIITSSAAASSSKANNRRMGPPGF